MEENQIYLGLDIGTNSVGWALTDKDYNILRLKGKDAWGARLFDSGETAEERRGFRASRRRNDRKKYRIELLNEIFKDQIDKIDQNFLERLKESQLYIKDKTVLQKNTLFNDANFNDKNFHNNYPTIYHLRHDLIKNGTNDIRLLYLAVHHILKHRGHFLNEGQELSVTTGGIDLLIRINNCLSDSFGEDACINISDYSKVLDIIKDKDKTINDKKRELKQQLNLNDQQNAIITSVLGGKSKISLILQDDSFEEDEANDTFDVKNEEISNIIEQNKEAYGDGYQLICTIKSLYDWSVLANILKDSESISEAMVTIYDKHKKDLKYLKDYINKYHREKYGQVFSNCINGEINYAHYAKQYRLKGKKEPIILNKDDKDLKLNFYKFIKDIIKDDENDDKKYIFTEIEKGYFLPKQVDKINGVIPYQLNLKELEIILDKSAKNFPFLNSVDSDGYVTKDKLIKILTFKIPYYVGPLNAYHNIEKGGFAWVKRNETFEKVRVTPWNFEKVIDLDASDEAFMSNLTNNCTYLINEPVLPKNSLLYSEFAILNVINKIKLCSNPIDVNLKQSLFTYLKSIKKISKSKIESYFITEGVITKSETDLISGIDSEINMSYPSYYDFRKIFKEDTDKYLNEIEQIIYLITQTADKKRLEQKIIKNFGDKFNEAQIKQILLLNYSGWAKLSKKLLDGITSIDKETGEILTLIQAMRCTTYNLQELLYNGYAFQKAIDIENNKNFVKTINDYSVVDSIPCSPAVKKQIWQTLTLVKDLKKHLAADPSKIFIEMARGEDNVKQRTISRKNALLEQYKKLEKDDRDYFVKELEGITDAQLRSERYYLFFTQLGRSMYSGQPITLNDIVDKQLYDCDHIYPKSKIKDDGLDNKVLVEKNINADKGDNYPINPEIVSKMLPFWKMLLQKNLISENKFKRLIRTTPLTIDECSDFISRQLVETRQTTKYATQIIKNIFNKSHIVYSKAGVVSDFRQEFEICKLREINDLHHAKDAYLNIVVGNTYDTKFGTDIRRYFTEKNFANYDIRKLFKFDITKAWQVNGTNRTIDKVRSTINKNTPLVTYYAEIGKGGLFDQTMQKKSDKPLIPLKDAIFNTDSKIKNALHDTTKYGGYSGITTGYFMLVKYMLKKKLYYSLEVIPLYIIKRYNDDISQNIAYLKQTLKVENIEVIIPKIKLNSLLKIDGAFVCITGKTNFQILLRNANQLYLNQEQTEYLKFVVNFLNKLKVYKNDLKIVEEFDKIYKDKNLELYDLFTKKLQMPTVRSLSISSFAELLNVQRQVFIDLSIEEQCKALFEILKLLQTTSATSNLTSISGAAHAGKLLKPNCINSFNEFKIINSSPSGLYCSEIDVMRLIK